MAVSINQQGVVFPNNTTQITAFPNLGILMWYGNINNIPAGWQLCDGTNGTPDLRDRFVVCAGGTYSVGATGGSSSVTLTAPQLPTHTHVVPAQTETSTVSAHTHETDVSTAPSHTHPYSPSSVLRTTTTGPTRGNAPPTGAVQLVSIGPANPHSHAVPSTNTTGSHTHTLSLSMSDFGSGDSHENRPPYHALAFIMKV